MDLWKGHTTCSWNGSYSASSSFSTFSTLGSCLLNQCLSHQSLSSYSCTPFWSPIHETAWPTPHSTKGTNVWLLMANSISPKMSFLMSSSFPITPFSASPHPLLITFHMFLLQSLQCLPPTCSTTTASPILAPPPASVVPLLLLLLLHLMHSLVPLLFLHLHKIFN